MNCAEIATLTPLYLSAELDPGRAAAFAAHLQICAACSRDIEQQRDLDARLRGALMAEETGTSELLPGIRRRITVAEAKRRVLTLVLTAASVILLAGGLLYRSFVAPPIPRIFADAARDHQREVVDRQVRKWRSAAAEIESLARQQGLAPNAVPAPAGYRLDRARLCRLDGSVFLHLVYTDGAREMSVFLRPRKGDAAPLRSQVVGTEHVVAVQSAGATVVCVAEETRAALELARSAAAAL